MNDGLSLNSIILARKVTEDEVVFLPVPMFIMLDGTLQKAFETSSDPYEKSWQSQDKNVTFINFKKVGRCIKNTHKISRILPDFICKNNWAKLFKAGLR